ncbi:MAG: trimeric autotransporter adhesin [Myxococcales bacterium]|nr:trimeric autotransporter adhesin [Myxococcales bacterium]
MGSFMTHRTLRTLLVSSSLLIALGGLGACGSAGDAPKSDPGELDASTPSEAGPGTQAPAIDGGGVNDAANSADADPDAHDAGKATFGPSTYIKASNTASLGVFGSAVSFSADGARLAVGARGESSSATGINGDQTSVSASVAGAVYVFVWSGTAWSQEAYIKASNTGAGDLFGTALSLSADGTRLAVGASSEDSSATGVNGNQADEGAPESGAVYVFRRSGTTWAQEAYVKASNPGSASATDGDAFGAMLSLSADGTRLAVGAYGEQSNATGVNGNQADNSLHQAGAVYVFVRSGTTWTQEAYVKASNPGQGDWFGRAVALSGDGSRLAVGALNESSNATGINGNQADNSAYGAGAVYMFARSGTTWSQEAYVKPSNTSAIDQFGGCVSLSADGTTLAVGADFEQSSAIGINGNGDQIMKPALYSGAAYVFTRSGTAWSQQAYIKASNTWEGHNFGSAVALSADGSRLAVGADHEDSGATGVNGNQHDGTAKQSGAAYVFSRSGTTWSQDAYVKASNTGLFDEFGFSIALSADGNHLASGARLENSNATGINGDQTNKSSYESGAVYVY